MNRSSITMDRGTEATSTFNASLAQRAAGAAALGAVFTLPVAVDAAVVYHAAPFVSNLLPVSQRNASSNFSGANMKNTFLDLDGNSVNDFRLLVRQSYDFVSSTHEGTALLQGLGSNVVLGFEGNAANLSASNMVSLGQSQSATQNALLRQVTAWSKGGTTRGNFSPSQNGIAGVAFTIGGNTHFGWIRLHVEDGPEGYPVSITAIDWAYQSTPNTPIHVADTFSAEVPEANPGLVLLAAGGTGLVAWRLRRRNAAKQAAQA